jgi:hypothetical protein
MSLFWICCVLGVGSLADTLSTPPENSDPSGCVQCHTDVKKLIRLSWEVERVRGRPAVSALTEGEG